MNALFGTLHSNIIEGEQKVIWVYDRDNGDINITRNKGWSFVNYR